MLGAMHPFVYKTFYLRAPDDGSGAAAPEPVVDAGATQAEAAAAATTTVEAGAEGAGEAKTDLASLAADASKSLLEEAAAKVADGAKPGAEAEASAEADKKPVEAEAAKPGEQAAGEGEKVADQEAAAVEAKPEHTPFQFEKFNLPENFTADEAKVKDFTDLLDNPELNPQERGQKLMDMYVGEMERVTKAIADHQKDVWTGIIDGWKDEFRKDPEIGGARQDTTLLTAAATVKQFLNEQEYADYMNLLSVSGVGNHRLQLKLLSLVGKALNVFEDGITVPASQKAPAKREFGAGWYGGNGSAQ